MTYFIQKSFVFQYSKSITNYIMPFLISEHRKSGQKRIRLLIEFFDAPFQRPHQHTQLIKFRFPTGLCKQWILAHTELILFSFAYLQHIYIQSDTCHRIYKDLLFPFSYLYKLNFSYLCPDRKNSFQKGDNGLAQCQPHKQLREKSNPFTKQTIPEKKEKLQI